MLSTKRGGIKYHFKILWYDSTWDWTQLSRTIGEHSTHLANEWKEKYERKQNELENMYIYKARVVPEYWYNVTHQNLSYIT